MTQKLRFLENRESPNKFSSGGTLALFVLASLALHIILIISFLLNYGAIARVAAKEPPSLVQLADGSAIRVASLGAKERTPEVIRRFVGDTMTLLMNWSGKLPVQTVEQAQNPLPDSGVSIKTPNGDRQVSSAAWQASFALSEDFRPQFLQKVANLTPQEIFHDSGTQVVLVTREISAPEKIKEGKWKVKLVANLITFQEGDNLGRAIAFNKEIFLSAVDVPIPPQETTDLAKAVYQIRQAGLEIYGIRDLQRENL